MFKMALVASIAKRLVLGHAAAAHGDNLSSAKIIDRACLVYYFKITFYP